MTLPLDRQQIVDRALSIVREHGLGGLSMRRLANSLGVQPGALYWHIASKQDLLAAVAEEILARPTGGGRTEVISTTDARQAACDLRAALLTVRDGADVVSFALALNPDGLVPVSRLNRLFTSALPDHLADWAARTLVYYVLGAVSKEQSHAELVRAGIRPAVDAAADADTDADNTMDAFLFGVDAILAGVVAAGQGLVNR